MSAVVLPSLNNRQVVRCTTCTLTQFATLSGNCRKCGLNYIDPEDLIAELEQKAPKRKKGEMVPRTKLDFGYAVKALRCSQNLTQKELARRIGVTRPYLSRLERDGKQCPRLDSIDKFAAALSVSPRELVALATIQ